jgi:hypothetical protein
MTLGDGLGGEGEGARRHSGQASAGGRTSAAQLPV